MDKKGKKQMTMKFKNLPVEDLKVHPKNKEYFKDISEISPTFWEEFKENINTLGLIEALIVNEKTMEVMSGNQRLLAAREIGLDTIPCLLVSPPDSETELNMMISSNVMRRETDPFTLFDYIAMVRKDSRGKGSTMNTSIHNRKELAKQIGKSGDTEFLTAAEIYNTLTEDQQKELKEWFYGKEGKDGEERQKEPTQAALIAEVKRMKEAVLIADKTNEELLEEIAKRKKQINEMKKKEDTKGEDIRKLKVENDLLRKAIKENDKEARQLKAIQKAVKDVETEMIKARTAISLFIEAMEPFGPKGEIKGMDRNRLIIAADDLSKMIQQMKPFLGGRK